MKKKIIQLKVIGTLVLLAAATGCFAQQQTLRIIGKSLTTVSGQSITLRGINYPIIDDGNISLSNASETHHKIDQAAMTGANAIRIPWYINGTHWRDNAQPGTIGGYLSNGHLSDLIGYCHTKGMIPILEIHNATCSNDWALFTDIVIQWWQQPEVLSLIEAHKQYLIINPANEFGYARWTGDTTSGIAAFKANYNTAIATLRDSGITVPIMIDAPDCGQSSTELLSIAESMVASDPEHNLMFSAHAYWSGYATTQSAIAAKLDEAAATNACFIIGEVASTQDGDNCGSISLASVYPIILQEACARNIGWLAWTYDQDCSAGREMTANGEYNTLTPYGNDLVNNLAYGLKSLSGCGAGALHIALPDKISSYAVYPNPARHEISIMATDGIAKAMIFDLSGRMLKEIKSDFAAIDISFLNSGSYIIQFETSEKRIAAGKFIKIP